MSDIFRGWSKSWSQCSLWISWESNRTVSGWRPLFDPRPNHDRLKLRIWIFRTSPRFSCKSEWFQNLPIQHYVTAPRYMDLHLYHYISKPPGVSRRPTNRTNWFTLDTMTCWFGLISLILCLSVCPSVIWRQTGLYEAVISELLGLWLS